MKTYSLILDVDVLEKYTKTYFTKHPRAKKKPITEPWHPSINQWCILPRIQMNALKQKWKDFIIWWIKDLGYGNLKLDKYSLEVTIYKPSKRRADPDNYTQKFVNDGLTEAGFIVDDDGEHCRSLILKTRYDKEHPRTEYLFTVLDND